MDVILIQNARILLNTNDVKDVKGLEYVGEGEDLQGKYIVRVFSKTPFIDFLFDDIAATKSFYKSVLKTNKVVDINKMRYGE